MNEQRDKLKMMLLCDDSEIFTLGATLLLRHHRKWLMQTFYVQKFKDFNQGYHPLNNMPMMHFPTSNSTLAVRVGNVWIVREGTRGYICLHSKDIKQIFSRKGIRHE